MRREPVAIINALVAVVEALIALYVGFYDPDWTKEQIATLMAVVIAIAEFFKTLIVRSKVTPIANPRDKEGRRLKPEQ